MKNILMNVEMTRAILDGRKTQTRRVIKEKIIKPKDSKFPDVEMYLDSYNNTKNWYWWTQDGRQNLSKCIKAGYQKDEVIWVREPAKVVSEIYYDVVEMEYTADGKKKNFDISRLKIDTEKKNVSNYPEWLYEKRKIPNGCIREMARIFLKITDVRVERLQDISNEDCLLEGVYEINDDDCSGKYKVYTIEKPNVQNGMILNDTFNSAYEAFEQLWNKTAKYGFKWSDNPFVFCYTFEVIKTDK